MRTSAQAYYTVLGIAPCKKGFGFAVLEARGRLISWGVGRLYSRQDDEFLIRLEGIIAKFGVGLVCAEDLSRQARWGHRARRVIELATAAATNKRICVSLISREILREELGLHEKATKYDIALRVVHLFPELHDLLPPPRRPWQTEDPRMALFIAASIGATQQPRFASG